MIMTMSRSISKDSSTWNGGRCQRTQFPSHWTDLHFFWLSRMKVIISSYCFPKQDDGRRLHISTKTNDKKRTRPITDVTVKIGCGDVLLNGGRMESRRESLEHVEGYIDWLVLSGHWLLRAKSSASPILLASLNCPRRFHTVRDNILSKP